MDNLLLVVGKICDNLLILLVAVEQVHCLEQGVGGHILGEITLTAKTGTVFACAIATGQFIGEKVNLSYHFAAIYGVFAICKGLK